jgi:putative peptidoglycan lipid II flippase
MTKNRLLRSASVVSLFTLLSRILGFIRDILLAMVFGAGAGFDAFVIAFRLPNFLRRLFAEGAFSQAFVPVLAGYKENQTPEEVGLFVGRMQGCLLACLLVVVALGEIIAPILVTVFAPGFLSDPGRFQEATHMLRITFPYILFISWVALLGAVYNTWKRFAVPAFTPALLNLSLIAAAAGFAPFCAKPIYALAWGVLAAGVVQLLWQLPMLVKMKLLFRPRWWGGDAGVKRVLKLIVPALFGVSVAQVSLLIDSAFASYLPTGSISWLYFSDRFTFFPLGVIGIAISTVVLPQLSTQSAKKDLAGSQRTLDWALRLVLLLGVPAAIGLAVLAGPILATLIHRGAFTAHDVVMTRLSLMAFSVGLPSFMLVKILASAFYSVQNIKTPVKVAFVALAVNLVLNAALIGPLHHVGLALATAVASWVNTGLLWIGLRKRQQFVPSRDWLWWMPRLFVASALMTWFLLRFVGPLEIWLDWTLMNRIWHLLAAIVLAVLVYAVSWVVMGLRPRHMRPN